MSFTLPRKSYQRKYTFIIGHELYLDRLVGLVLRDVTTFLTSNVAFVASSTIISEVSLPDRTSRLVYVILKNPERMGNSDHASLEYRNSKLYEWIATRVL